jgi:CheY-like chemotaxis protein
VARILVVDDEPDVRELFNITLKMAGHETETVKHGLEAVERLATDTPDLIVLDLMMPHMDGFTFLNHVRTEMPTKPMRVLVATAKVLEDADQERLGDWPVVGILNKGELDIGQMVLVVSTALAKSAFKEGVVAAPAPAPEKAAAAAAPVAPPAAPPAPAPAAPAPQPAASTTSTPPTRPSTGIPTPVPQPTFGPKIPPSAPSEPAKPAAAEPEAKPAAGPAPASPQPATSGSSSVPAVSQSAEPTKLSDKPAEEPASSEARPQTGSAGESPDKPVPPKIAP